MMRASADPEADAAFELYRKIKAQGGRPVAWKTKDGGYFVRDELEV